MADSNKKRPNDTDTYDINAEGKDMNNMVDLDDISEGFRSDIEDNLKEGLTPMHRQNIDEARIDEVLVEDTLDDKHYPTIRDIADKDAVQHSHEEDL